VYIFSVQYAFQDVHLSHQQIIYLKTNMKFLNICCLAAVAVAIPSGQDSDAIHDTAADKSDYWVFLKPSSVQGSSQAFEKDFNLQVLERETFEGMELLRVNEDSTVMQKIHTDGRVSPYFIIADERQG
jgi:hypothetical protein